MPQPRRRALELLAAASHDGATEALMIARRFTLAQMVELVRAGHSGQYESNGRSM
jgi:hypothetical protein